MRIEPLLEGGDRIWMEELEMYYTFFYEIRNGRRVLGKDRIKEIFFCKMNARDVLFSGFFVCACVVVVSWYAFITKA